MRYGETPKRTKIRRLSGESDAAQGNSTNPNEAPGYEKHKESELRRKGWRKRKDGTWGPPSVTAGEGFYRGKRNKRT